MGVDYFVCRNCGEAHSEYDQITCENCEQYLCSCAMPDEISRLCGCWDDVWGYIRTDRDDNIVAKEGTDEATLAIFQKYLSINEDYGLVLKEEYCPLCQRAKEQSKDPEYLEYLRLKAKFEESI